MTAGGAIARAIDVVIEKGRKVAARLLEAADGDIDYRAGAFTVIGTDRRVSLFVVAALASLRRVVDRPVYRLVYTPPDSPLQVVRLIVPLLEHFSQATKRMGPRMRAELEALARRGA